MDPLHLALPQTPSQTVGPYFAYGLTAEQYHYPYTSINCGDMVDDTIPGQRITIRGKIYDGENNPVPDAMIEMWQADSEGKYHYNLQNPQRLFGRQGTGTLESCEFIFHTIKPGPVDGQAPHINVILFMRGQLSHVYTRIYFEEDAAMQAGDEVWLSVPVERLPTLLAIKIRDGQQEIYQFDIYMQGEKETVFFDV